MKVEIDGPCLRCCSMTASSTCPVKICQRCHKDAENEEAKGPGMSLSGEKYLLRAKSVLTMMTAATIRAWGMLAAGSDRVNISTILNSCK